MSEKSVYGPERSVFAKTGIGQSTRPYKEFQTKRERAEPRGSALPSGYRVTSFPVYLLLTLMTFGLTSSALGNVSVSTPFSKCASALSAFTGTFSVNRREKEP